MGTRGAVSGKPEIPSSDSTLSLLAVHASTKMAEPRIEALRRMAEARPEDPRLQFGLAVELLNAGQVREGAEALRAYLAVAEDEGNGWARLGGALEELGDVNGAREAYARGLEIAAGRGHEGLAEEMREALENLA